MATSIFLAKLLGPIFVLALLDWIATIHGGLILAAPEHAMSLARRAMEREAMLPAAAAIAILLGGYLCFFGYIG